MNRGVDKRKRGDVVAVKRLMNDLMNIEITGAAGVDASVVLRRFEVMDFVEICT